MTLVADAPLNSWIIMIIIIIIRMKKKIIFISIKLNGNQLYYLDDIDIRRS